MQHLGSPEANPVHTEFTILDWNLYELIPQSQFIANQFSEMGFLFVNITKTDIKKKLQGAFQSSTNETDIDRFSITKN